MAFDSRRYEDPRGQRGFAGRGFGGGGFNADGPRGWTITTWLIVINAVVFLLAGIFGGSARGDGIDPFRWGFFSIDKAVYGGQVWRFVTYQFLHGGLLHVFFNMLLLYYLGPMLEQMLGRRPFLAFYLACGASGAVVASALGLTLGETVMHPAAPLIGASGAVYGLLAACAVRFPDREMRLILPPITLRLRTLCLIFLGFSALSVTVGSENAGGDAAHLGGALLGFLLARFPAPLSVLGGPELAGGYGTAKRSGGGIEGMKKRLANFQRERRRKAAAAHAAEVDRILAKVSDRGIQSLTEAEKKTLAEDTKQKR